MDLEIGSGFYVSESLPISAQQCVNLQPNKPQTKTPFPMTLLGTPGINQLTTSGTIGEINRGGWVKNGIAYEVNGTTLYRVNRVINADLSETFTMVALGMVAGTDPVVMKDNGTQLMILVPGGNGYIYDENAGTPFQQIVAAGFTANGNPQYLAFMDSYFICSTDSKNWIISGPNDGLSWNALDVSTAEADPDDIVAPIVFRNTLFMTGSKTTEGFQRVINGAGFPFVRSNMFLPKGCFAPRSLIAVSNTFLMIGGGENESPAIWYFTGNDYDKLSTTAIDVLLSEITDTELANAFAFQYGEKGAYFVGFTFGNYTFLYDFTSQEWHQRESTIEGGEIKWRVNSMISAYGRILVGDSVDGRIGELRSDIFMEYGNQISRVVASQPFYNQGQPIDNPEIELLMETGVGNEDCPDPKVSLEVSKNGGKTYGPQRLRGIGKVGEYKRRIIWSRNGSFQPTVVFRWRITDPVKVVILGARGDLE